MDLLQLVLAIAVVGFVVWLITTIPMGRSSKRLFMSWWLWR